MLGIGRGDNAAILAVQIMAVENMELAQKLANYRKELVEMVEKDAESLLGELVPAQEAAGI